MFVELIREPGKKAVTAVLGKCQSEVGIGREPSGTPTTGSLGAADTGVRKEGATVEHVPLLGALCSGAEQVCVWERSKGMRVGAHGAMDPQGPFLMLTICISQSSLEWRIVGGREA